MHTQTSYGKCIQKFRMYLSITLAMYGKWSSILCSCSSSERLSFSNFPVANNSSFTEKEMKPVGTQLYWGRPVPPRASNALSRKFVVMVTVFLHEKSAKSFVRSWVTVTRHWTKHAFSWICTVSALRLSLATIFVKRLQTVRVRTPTVIKRAKTFLRFLQKAIGQKNFH